MSLNTLILSTRLITDLYSGCLISAASTGSPAKSSTVPPPQTLTGGTIRFLGKNQQKIAILVNYPEHAYLPEDALEFLTSILKACRLNMADIAIINHAVSNASPSLLVEELGTRKLILFGSYEQFGSNFPLFEIGKENGMEVLSSLPLEQLNGNNEDSKAGKARLWTCLKQFFNV